MGSHFARLSEGWNAEPNAPMPTITIDENTLTLTFYRNYQMFPEVLADTKMSIVFRGCRRFRLGRTNDEGWYRGQCRFSGIAPAWGEFYEVSGDLRDSKIGDDEWTAVSDQPGPKRFLFYFRDETFECDAESFDLVF